MKQGRKIMQVKSVGKQKKKKNMLRKDIAYQPELT